MKKSPLCKALSDASWVLTALAAINYGLKVLGHDVILNVAMRMPALAMPLYVAIGVAGVYSLVCFVKCSLKGSC